MKPVNQLSDAKRRLLERRQRGEVSSQSKGIPFQARDRSVLAPLAPSQQQVWLHAGVAPQSPIYNEPITIHYRGPLDRSALDRTVQEFLRRHEIWRTSFITVDGQVMQSVHPVPDSAIPFIDLTLLPENKREAEALRIASADAHRPFDLATGPMIRLRLLRFSSEYHRIHITMHHIIFDGVSIYRVLVSELSAIYAAFSQGLPSPLPEPEHQYGDYAVWQTRLLESEPVAHQMDYWRQQLSGELATLELPTDRARPAVPSYRGSMETFAFSGRLTEAIKQAAAAQHVTVYMYLMAAFKAQLHRYSGQNDILVGGVTDGRKRPELEQMVGFFLNTFVVRTRPDGEMTFAQFLPEVKDAVLGALAASDVPFDKIVREIQPRRDLSRHPIFQVLFSVEPPASSYGEHWDLTQMDISSGTSKFDLYVELDERPDEMIGRFLYNSDLFDPKTIRRMVNHYLKLVESVVSSPNQRLSVLPILTDEERQQLLVEWNDTRVAYPRDVLLHQLFEKQVAKSPNAVAVEFEQTSVTYRELDQRANQLAHHLRSLGVRPDQLVGVFMERSLEMVVALYGILKAGGAYVPIDPEYPADRVAFMVNDAGVSVLLTQSHLTEKLPENQAKVICLDSQWDQISRQSDAKPADVVTAKNLAYMIYTSGSTGKPKGAMNEHVGIVNRLLWMQDAYRLTPADRVMQKTPFSFDVSVWEFFWPLIAGARLVVAAPGGHRDPSYLVRLIEQKQISVMHFVPPMLQVFLQEAQTQKCRSLRHVICSGEALSFELQELFFDQLAAQLHNLYGPTEAAVDVTHWTCRRHNGLSFVPIGRPVANTQTYILDSRRQPTPVGVPGELYLGGVQIGRGYHNRPELTAEKFIADPFSSEPGARLYRTGDLARYLPDGNIEFLGRIDNQVKIRGFRIELGEIEAVLASRPSVREAMVLARQDSPGDKRLVAYLTSKEGTAPSVSDLRALLQAKLPDYMVPSAFVMLDRFPLSPNGKVDRKALPAPDTARPELERSYTAPNSPAEKALAAIWSQVLRVDKVGIHDKFFELGGDSILSMQVIAKANNAGWKVTLKQIFQYQTIAELAFVAEAVASREVKHDAVIGDIPLTPIQKSFFEQNYADEHHWNQAMLLELRQDIPPQLIEKAIQELVVHHDALQFRFVRDDQGWRQFQADSAEAFKLELVDLAATSDADLPAAIERAAARLQGGLNLSQGPVVRVALFDPGKRRPKRLLFVIHHLVVDGVSWRILLEDLQTICRQLQSGGAVSLPDKTSSFGRWAQGLTQYAGSSSLEKESAYWLNTPSTQIAPIPVDFSGGENTEASVRTVSTTLSLEETCALLLQVPQAYNTQINDVLLSALGLSLTSWVGQPVVRIHLEGHGREDLVEGIDLSRTVGWFTSVFPVNLDLRGKHEPGEVLKSIKEQIHRIPQRGIGYGILRYLRAGDPAAAQLQALPQPQIIFNYLGQFDQTEPASPFRLIEGSVGPVHSPRARRGHLLEINGLVADNKLRMDWLYSEAVHRRGTIEQLARTFMESLRSIIRHCASPDAGGYTPSDFAGLDLDQDKLDQLISDIGD